MLTLWVLIVAIVGINKCIPVLVAIQFGKRLKHACNNRMEQINVSECLFKICVKLSNFGIL